MPGQFRRQLVEPVVQIHVVVGLTRDDQRRPRLVYQDGVDFVDDRVREPALHSLRCLEDHVVAQVVEAELVVRAVGDVRGVCCLLRAVLHLRQVDADGHAQKTVDPAHPVGVALREVVVDGHYVHAVAGERVEVRRQRRHQRLAFTGAHLADLAVMKRYAADKLHVEMAHLQRALAGFAHHGECFGHDRIDLLAIGDALLEDRGLGLELIVRQCRDFGLERVDAPDHLRVLLEQPLVTAAENLGKDVGDHCRSLPPAPHGGQQI